MSTKKIAIFVSGTGSNARVMIDNFRSEAFYEGGASSRLQSSQPTVNSQPATTIEVALVVSNNPAAKALEMAATKGIATLVVHKKTFRETEEVLETLREFGVEFIVLAGFLWLMPTYLVQAYVGRMVNIHPALLPKYGGKGMYGMHVHRAVHAASEPESGITIHYVNEHYDEGAIIYQAATSLLATDTPEDIAAKVLQLEHDNYSRVVKEILLGKD
ncbi:MAG: phosphoribosylglycinamide formyltransferase [Bacteroidota bacterium]